MKTRIDDGGPAFPGISGQWDEIGGGQIESGPSGMSLLDYFAATLPDPIGDRSSAWVGRHLGIKSPSSFDDEVPLDWWHDREGDLRYMRAGAMLRARARYLAGQAEQQETEQ